MQQGATEGSEIPGSPPRTESGAPGGGAGTVFVRGTQAESFACYTV